MDGARTDDSLRRLHEGLEERPVPATWLSKGAWKITTINDKRRGFHRQLGAKRV